VGLFKYMGRERFSELWTKVDSFERGFSFSKLFLNGTMGAGKSHMLAALTCLLFRLGRRPVYIPDCRQLCRDPLPYIQSALLCAFADPSSALQRNEIRSLQSMESAKNFCRNRAGSKSLYFIVDQINALEHEPPNADDHPNARKEELALFLKGISTGHFYIYSASANYRTARWMAQKQTGEDKMSIMGGMSEVRNPLWTPCLSLDSIRFCFYRGR